MTHSRSQSCANRRVQFLRGVFAIVLAGGMAYAALLAAHYRDFREYARRIQLDSIIPLAGRGRILDAEGRALALTRTSFKVRIDSRQLRKDNKVEKAAHVLARICACDSIHVAQDMKTRVNLCVFDPDMNYEVGDSLRHVVRRIDLDNCILVEPQMTRLYPYSDTVGSILGFASHDSGRAGLEAVLNPALAGVPGKVIVEKDGLGNRYRFPAYPDIQPVDGADVTLTIDLDIQRIAYEELASCVDSFKADGGSAIVMDCPTGEIKAMCDFPYYDPRKPCPEGDTPTYRCRAAEESFEPGSVFKPVMGLAAMESDNADRIRNTCFHVASGKIEICGKTIHDVHAAGDQDFPGVFIHSSNVGLSMISMMVDRSLFYQTMLKLGFGKRTGIELPDEDSGYIDDDYRVAPSRMSPLRVANNSFGQGLRVTLLQLADCFATIANDGVLHRPFMVQNIDLGDGSAYRTEPLEVRRAVTPEAAREMKEILGRVVTEGTGEIAASPLFTACGKTGTAEKPPYSSKEVIATFVGFFPKENPQYVVAISVDNPRIGKYAGTIACPAFRRICERCCLLPIPGSKFQVTSSQLPVASQLGTVNVRHDTGNSDGAKQ